MKKSEGCIHRFCLIPQLLGAGQTMGHLLLEAMGYS